MSHRVKERKVGKGRNDLCPCGSGKKYKNCCGANRTGKGGNHSFKRPAQIKSEPAAPKKSKPEAMALLAMTNGFMIDTTTRRIPRRIHPE